MSPEQGYDEPDNSGKTKDRLLSELRELREAGAKSKGFAEALMESEEKFRALTETSPAMVLFHQGGKFLYANPASEKITGYTHDELLNMDFWGFVSPDYRDIVKERGLARLRGENPVPHYLIKILTRQGKEKWLYLSSARMIYRGRTAIMVNAMDVTKRKRAEEALRESEGRFRAIFNQAAMGIGIADHDGRILDCNNVFQAMLGYGKEELLQRHFAEITYPDDVEKNVDQFKRSVAGQIDKYQMEKRYVRKDGSLIWCMLTSSVIRDANGGFKYSLAIIDDITESKRLKEKLAHAASFPELNPNPILEVDVAGVITYMNPAASQLFPDLRSKGMGHPMLEGIPPGIFKKGEKIEFIREVQVNDTTYHQIIHFLPDRRTARIYSMDITGRKRSEKALRDSQASLNSIFRAAPSGIGVVVDRVIKEANDRLCEMTGYTREELLGKNARIFYPSDKDYEFVGREKYDQIHRSGTGVVETRWRRKDGSVIDILLSSTPMDPGDLHAGVTFTALDITERKRDEKELIDAKEQAELYLDLMGHDINNIHQAALGYLELARDMPGDSRDEYLDKAMEALKRSARLINNVRKLQKFQDSKARAHDVDLCVVLSGVHDEYANAPGKALTLDLGSRTHCRVRADDLLHDVFSNLVSNAVKHTGDRASIAISLDAARKDGKKYCRVLVEDDGPGIPDEAKRTLFNRSLRGTSRAKGMGLGLYIVKTLVENYGGLVWAEDRIKGDHSKGVRFVVMLPAVE